MTRNLKLLGIAIVVVLAMIAMVASAASADVFHVTRAPAILTGSLELGEVDKLVVDAGTIQCKKATYVGTQNAIKSGSVLVTPTYSECTSFGLASQIDMNGCQYRFNVTAGAGITTGTADIVCPAGAEITITAPPEPATTKCVIHVPSQNGLSKVTYSNQGAGETEEITILAQLTGIKYNQTEGTGLGKCLTSDNQTDGTDTGRIVLTGEEDPDINHIGIKMSDS